MTIRVHLLPRLTSQEELAGQTVLVIDVLRATTTIVTALHAGAAEVIPCLDVQEARSLARQRPGALLGGERNGRPIAGFDLGNSPAEYSAERVHGRSIIFTTTNGTRALITCVAASPIFLGGFVNLSAVVGALRSKRVVHLVCAGTDGEVTREDALLAGAVVRGLREQGAYELNDAARLAEGAWISCGGPTASGAHLAAELRESGGGRNLRRLGMDEDIVWAATIDRSEVVPQLDRASWTIRAADKQLP